MQRNKRIHFSQFYPKKKEITQPEKEQAASNKIKKFKVLIFMLISSELKEHSSFVPVKIINFITLLREMIGTIGSPHWIIYSCLFHCSGNHRKMRHNVEEAVSLIFTSFNV